MYSLTSMGCDFQLLVTFVCPAFGLVCYDGSQLGGLNVVFMVDP